jgi:Zn finger protein HypA/HybF involved in hydrogenase expression
MHDQVLARKLIEEARKNGDVAAIEVSVGELSGVEARDLRKALSALVSWRLTVSTKKASVSCGCGYRGRPKIIGRAHDLVFFECPSCGKTPQVLSGADVVLRKVGV